MTKMMWPWYHGGFGGFGGFGGYWVMIAMMVIIFGLVIWGIVMLVRWVRHNDYHTTTITHSDSAMEILKTRYAKGEISKEEFEEKRRAIS